MNKIYLLFDETILNYHHGVRRYALTIFYNLKKNFEIKIILCKNTSLFELEIDDDYCKNNGFYESNYFEKGKKNILKKLETFSQENIKKSLRQPRIIKEIFREQLDKKDCILILAAPWVDINIDLQNNRRYCIAHDAIPNIYSLEKPYDYGLLQFASKHVETYKKYVENYCGLLCNSDETKRQCDSVLLDEIENSYVIPATFPPGFENISVDTMNTIRNENQIILAAPFDTRKGFKIMPDLINLTKNCSLIIFGGIRCDISEVINFFETLDTDNVVWWYNVDFHTQVRLYSESNTLLFPSLSEGLGLPIIEASACGTNCLVSDISPINRMVNNRGIIKKNDDFNNTIKLKESLILDNIKINKNKYESYDRWGSNKLIKFFETLFI